MQTTATAHSEAKAEDLRHRRHTLNPNRTFLDRCGGAAPTMMESGVARVSRHGEPNMYDTKLFPWAAEV